MPRSSIEQLRATAPVIYLCGGITTTLPNTDIPNADKPGQMLAVLALNTGKALSIEYLKRELWNEKLPQSHKTTFQTYIVQLRRLGFQIETARQSYKLCGVTPDQVDVLQFLSAVNELQKRPPATLLERLEAWEWAGDILQGGILVDINHGETLREWVAHVQSVQRSVVYQTYVLRLHMGHHAYIVEELENEWRFTPHREDLAVLAMVALYRCIRRADAIRVYHETLELLEKELGCDPTQRLKQLYYRISKDDESLLDLRQPIPGLQGLMPS